MPIDIRTYLDDLLKSGNISKEESDCIFEEYLRVKELYLAGNLHKSMNETIAKIYVDLEKNGFKESDVLPNVQDMVLLIMAKKICGKSV